MARQSVPDVITMDISLSDMSGLEVTRRLKRELPRLEVVVTVHEEREYGDEAVKAGASGGYARWRGSGCPFPACGPGEVISEAGMFLSR